jgi:hypothetical protein
VVQIALFVAPVLVLLSYLIGPTPMDFTLANVCFWVESGHGSRIAECLLMTDSRHACPLLTPSGTKRTWPLDAVTSANDPKPSP